MPPANVTPYSRGKTYAGHSCNSLAESSESPGPGEPIPTVWPEDTLVNPSEVRYKLVSCSIEEGEAPANHLKRNSRLTKERGSPTSTKDQRNSCKTFLLAMCQAYVTKLIDYAPCNESHPLTECMTGWPWEGQSPQTMIRVWSIALQLLKRHPSSSAPTNPPITSYRLGAS